MSYLSGRTTLTTVQTADIADNAITLAKMAGGTDGNLIGIDASGDPAYIATGDDGQVLTSGGAGVAALMETAAGGGGKLLQVVTSNAGAAATSTTTVPLDDTIPQNTEGGEFMTLAITPTASDSTLIIQAFAICTCVTANRTWVGSIFVDSTANALSYSVVRISTWADWTYQFATAQAFVSAASTSSRTYKFRAGADVGNIHFNSNSAATDNAANVSSHMVIWEIGA
jgi:hypothetical protein